MPSPITHLFAGVPVSDLDAGIDGYTRFFGRPPDLRAGQEVLWDLDEHATLFIEPDPASAGTGRITFAVTGSTRSCSASPGIASGTSRSRPTATASGTRRCRTPTGTPSRWPRSPAPRRARPAPAPDRHAGAGDPLQARRTAMESGRPSMVTGSPASPPS
jgi:hypothetical protein